MFLGLLDGDPLSSQDNGNWIFFVNINEDNLGLERLLIRTLFHCCGSGSLRLRMFWASWIRILLSSSKY